FLRRFEAHLTRHITRQCPHSRSDEGRTNWIGHLCFTVYCVGRSECIFSHRRDDDRPWILGFTQRFRRSEAKGEVADHSRSSPHRRRFPRRRHGSSSGVPSHRIEMQKDLRKKEHVAAAITTPSASICTEDGYLTYVYAKVDSRIMCIRLYC
ncbi:hypothetical protein PENTCL1PPCAC_21381, partial [Pristionchus entomophagus]